MEQGVFVLLTCKLEWVDVILSLRWTVHRPNLCGLFEIIISGAREVECAKRVGCPIEQTRRKLMVSRQEKCLARRYHAPQMWVCTSTKSVQQLDLVFVAKRFRLARVFLYPPD
jgi:hypothetical protein